MIRYDLPPAHNIKIRFKIQLKYNLISKFEYGNHHPLSRSPHASYNSTHRIPGWEKNFLAGADNQATAKLVTVLFKYTYPISTCHFFLLIRKREHVAYSEESDSIVLLGNREQEYIFKFIGRWPHPGNKIVVSKDPCSVTSERSFCWVESQSGSSEATEIIAVEKLNQAQKRAIPRVGVLEIKCHKRSVISQIPLSKHQILKILDLTVKEQYTIATYI